MLGGFVCEAGKATKIVLVAGGETVRPAELPACFEIDNKDAAFLYRFHG